MRESGYYWVNKLGYGWIICEYFAATYKYDTSFWRQIGLSLDFKDGDPNIKEINENRITIKYEKREFF